MGIANVPVRRSYTMRRCWRQPEAASDAASVPASPASDGARPPEDYALIISTTE